ncbi:hypothetical protein ACOMHN_052331 [Nucella lapillus]
MRSVAELLVLLSVTTVVFGQLDLANVLQCANAQSGVCRQQQCQSGEFSVLPLGCALYTAIFGATYQRCVTSMPCCYWGAACQTSCGTGQRQLSSAATCSNAAQVCCIASSLVPTATPAPPITTTTTTTTTRAPTPVTALITVATRQGRCGRQTWSRTGSRNVDRYLNQYQPRIIGGSVAGPLDWPWMVRVTFTSTTTGFCAGVLVDDDTVVTAAHCVAGVDTGTIRVVLGDYDLSAFDQEQEVVGVSRQIIPSTFRRGTRGNDFAVLKLSRRVRFTDRKLPACLYDPTLPLLHPPQCYVAGWGVSESGLGGPLRAMNVQLLDSATCQQQMSAIQGGAVTMPQDIVCTANPPFSPSDGCLYDDGDMLVCRDIRGRWSLIGVMSEYSCGRALPSLFTDVRRYTDVILNLL